MWLFATVYPKRSFEGLIAKSAAAERRAEISTELHLHGTDETHNVVFDDRDPGWSYRDSNAISLLQNFSGFSDDPNVVRVPFVCGNYFGDNVPCITPVLEKNRYKFMDIGHIFGATCYSVPLLESSVNQPFMKPYLLCMYFRWIGVAPVRILSNTITSATSNPERSFPTGDPSIDPYGAFTGCCIHGS
jgi:hypothetical protein